MAHGVENPLLHTVACRVHNADNIYLDQSSFCANLLSTDTTHRLWYSRRTEDVPATTM